MRAAAASRLTAAAARAVVDSVINNTGVIEGGIRSAPGTA